MKMFCHKINSLREVQYEVGKVVTADEREAAKLNVRLKNEAGSRMNFA